MNPLLRSLTWGCAAMAVLLSGLLGRPSPAHAQVAGDTTTVDTLGGEGIAPPPAPLDSVESTDVASPDTSEPEKAIVRADSLSAVEREGERVQELFDNVRVRQDTTRLRSAFGLRYLNRDELLFTGDVVIYERGDTLRADTVRYNKRTKVGRARSNVRLTDGEVVVRAPRATYYTEEKRSVFPDSVTLVDSTRVLRAQKGTYWSDEERAAFRGEVQLNDPDTFLEADSLTYFRKQERSIATGQVFIRRVEAEESDTTATTYLFGEWADNQEQNRYSRVERQALLVRVRRDSAGTPSDTLAVRAHRLEATRTDTHRRLVAVDSVRVWQPDLAAVGDSLVYDRVIEAGTPDTATPPTPIPDTTTGRPADSTTEHSSRLDSLVAQVEIIPLRRAESGRVSTPPRTASPSPPDSAGTLTDRDTGARGESDSPSRASRAQATPPDSGRADSTGVSSRRKGDRWSRPVARTDEQLPLEETRLFRNPITWFERAQVWGDSIRVRARDRSLDTVYVRGAAFAAQEDTTVDRIRQLKGKNITAVFRANSLRTIFARPNGQAIYFSAGDDGMLDGATQASADEVTLHFADRDVERITFGGGVEGQAYHKKEYVPDPFRLEGFQWTPERRPRRARVLRERRVRERLDLDSLSAPKTRRVRPITDLPADSGRSGVADSLNEAPAAPPASGRRSTETTGGEPRRPPGSQTRPPDSLRAETPPTPAPASDSTQSPRSEL